LPDYLKNSPFIFDPSVKNSSEVRNSSGYRLIPDWQFLCRCRKSKNCSRRGFSNCYMQELKKLVYPRNSLLPEEDFSRSTFKSLNDLLEQMDLE
jgi:hypothetical protein